MYLSIVVHASNPTLLPVRTRTVSTRTAERGGFTLHTPRQQQQHHTPECIKKATSYTRTTLAYHSDFKHKDHLILILMDKRPLYLRPD